MTDQWLAGWRGAVPALTEDACRLSCKITPVSAVQAAAARLADVRDSLRCCPACIILSHSSALS